jgi:hypothetical protein
MERKSWNIDVDATQHEVVLRWTTAADAEATVDGAGRQPEQDPDALELGQEFDVDGHRGVMRTKPSKPISVHLAISLDVDGREVPADPGSRTGRPQAGAPQAGARPARAGRAVDLRLLLVRPAAAASMRSGSGSASVGSSPAEAA